MKRFLFVLAAALVSSCSLNTDAPNDPSDPTKETFAASLNVDIASMTRTTNGAYYRDLTVGAGDPISGQPSVVISYIEFLKDAKVVGTVSSATQLLSRMVPGLQEGVQGMKPNGERLIVVPSALGYGNSTTIPGVPPNSTLIFDLIYKGLAAQ
jgi:FKBP-type peptidyl-prolyl cis-trans isomerase FkpA